MKFTTILSVALVAATASADSLNVASVISEFYPDRTPDIKPAQSTSLASALHSVQTTWLDSPKHSSVISAIYSAVTFAPSSVQASLSKSGFREKEITSMSWYTKNVPKAQQTYLANQISAEDSAAAKIVGTPSTSTNGAMRTAAPMMAAAGLVGGILASL